MKLGLGVDAFARLAALPDGTVASDHAYVTGSSFTSLAAPVKVTTVPVLTLRFDPALALGTALPGAALHVPLAEPHESLKVKVPLAAVFDAKLPRNVPVMALGPGRTPVTSNWREVVIAALAGSVTEADPSVVHPLELVVYSNASRVMTLFLIVNDKEREPCDVVPLHTPVASKAGEPPPSSPPPPHPTSAIDSAAAVAAARNA